MKLIYISEANLKNHFFIKEFVSAYAAQKGKALLLHESFGSVEDTRFVTKRLSSLLSEVMVYNNAFSGDQKSIFSKSDGRLSVKRELLDTLSNTVDMLILSTLQVEEGNTVKGDGIALAKALRETMPIEETLVFSVNSKSPVSQVRKVIASKVDVGNWVEVYEEEKAALDNAVALAPAVLTSTRLF